ncbi:hypothetical protein D9619_007603 [Psilocybe cf. subviscida]|uniref:Uncharacterized protein n=1 Tax=Psilocybe cf. subviscida TaxID=2480587 RepID=A0A8H5B1I8_9AGAR|nr:hypothetical protein D9619_007603 [Psilocybe cf. subviscida]
MFGLWTNRGDPCRGRPTGTLCCHILPPPSATIALPSIIPTFGYNQPFSSPTATTTLDSPL